MLGWIDPRLIADYSLQVKSEAGAGHKSAINALQREGVSNQRVPPRRPFNVARPRPLPVVARRSTRGYPEGR